MTDAGFRDYEREFNRLTEKVPTRLEALTQFESDPAAQTAEVRRIDSDITQAKQMISSMQLEVRSLPEPQRSQLGNTVRTYQSNLTALAAEVAKVKEATSRKALLGSVTSPTDGNINLGASRSQREKMMESTEKLHGQTSSLEQARRTLAETEDVAVDITTELDRNRETLLSARRKVTHVTSATDQARRILTAMARREVRIKIMMGGLIVLILLIIGIVAYYIGKK